MTDSTGTTTKQQVPPQLVGKGFKERPQNINRKGRPKSFDKLRDLAVSLANETAKDSAGKAVEFEGHTATQIEMLLRLMLRENPARFVEIAFGKVPDEVKIIGDKNRPLVIETFNYATSIAAIATRSSEDNQSSGED